MKLSRLLPPLFLVFLRDEVQGNSLLRTQEEVSHVENPHRRQLGGDVSGDLFGFLFPASFCVPLNGNTYETVRVWRWFGWFYRLRGDEPGTCGEVCDIVCDHTPCVVDFEASPDGNLCDCLDETSPSCGINSQCLNEGCVCNPGYEGNPLISPTNAGCTDKKECATPNRCGSVGTCSELEGSYSCTCPTGYTWPGVGFPCEDRNECIEGRPCGENAICFNTAGSYTCACETGYRGTPPNVPCIDILECTENPDICGPGTCVEAVGSYSCTCDAGFTWPGIGKACRKLLEWENCPSTLDSDCNTGLTCAFTSLSDESTYSCCKKTVRCNVNDDCCVGAYEQGEECPSTSDTDCRGDLKCERRGIFDWTYVCCNNVFAGFCVDL
jgi:hypothetical protein